MVLKPNCALVANRKFEWTDSQVLASLVRHFPLQLHANKSLIYNIADQPAEPQTRQVRIGVLLNGQQAPGVANVLCGLWEKLTTDSPHGRVFGFMGGVVGLLASPPRYIELTREDLALSRNQGGFDLLGREKEAEMMIATPEGLEAAGRVCVQLQLDGWVWNEREGMEIGL